MPDKPILIFPAATIAARQTLTPSFGRPGPRPTQASQQQRLATRFQALGIQFGTIQADTGGVDPEQVIVFETVGSVGDFQNVVKKVPGMEWLGDFDAEIADPDPGFLADGTASTQMSGRLFVVVGKRTAYNEILRLWNVWLRARNEKLPRGFGPLAEVFKHLQEVRPWGPKDRVQATGVLAFWERGLVSNMPSIRFEVELWCRNAPGARDAAYNRLQAIATEIRGQCIKQSAFPEIDYHGVLVELPADAVRNAVTALTSGTDTKLLRLTDVKYFAPMGQAAISPNADGTPGQARQLPAPTGNAVAALLDGLPLTNHAALQGRLIVDDPDNYSAVYGLGEHRHGTAMASLITSGEQDSNEIAISSKLYVRPIMHPGPPDHNNQRWEMFPPNDLPVDVIHRAVKRIIEGDAGQPAQGPAVKVINLSVGDSSQLFDRILSPWARLLDWLAWKYKVLFVVSAGNHLVNLSIPAPPGSIAGMSDQDLRAHTLRAMAHQRVQRRLLAPAESVNSLTVGALHGQTAPAGNAGRLVDVLRSIEFPSPVSSVASGFRRSIKPEILVPGGRRHYSPRIQPNGAATAEFEIVNLTNQPGQLVAAPGGNAIPPNHASRVSGTSNAAALTTRRAIQFIDRIEQMRSEPGGQALLEERTAVILKAMLVHGASWGDNEALIDQIFDGPDSGIERWWRIKRACAQFFGYGPADFERGTVCSDQRVIVLGCDELPFDKAHVYRIPLPPALSAQRTGRKLTITLAWLTPTNPRHRNYCGADLWFDPPDTQLQIKRTDAGDKMVKQGTVQHEVLAGDSAVPINDGDTLPIQVNCRSDGGYRGDATIPYALMVSLETARPLAASVYEQVKTVLERLRTPTPLHVAAGTPRPSRR